MLPASWLLINATLDSNLQLKWVRGHSPIPAVATSEDLLRAGNIRHTHFHIANAKRSIRLSARKMEAVQQIFAKMPIGINCFDANQRSSDRWVQGRRRDPQTECHYPKNLLHFFAATSTIAQRDRTAPSNELAQQMDFAIESSDGAKRQVSAHDKYQEVRAQRNWGVTQRLEEWRCLSCGEPVFLRGPHRRSYSLGEKFVSACFAHYNTTASKTCAHYCSGIGTGSPGIQVSKAARSQSLYKYLELLSTRTRDASKRLVQETRRSSELCYRYRHELRELCPIPKWNIPAVNVDFDITRIERYFECVLKASKRMSHLELGLICFGLDHCVSIHDFKLHKGEAIAEDLRRFLHQFGKARAQYLNMIIQNGAIDLHVGLMMQSLDRAQYECELARGESKSIVFAEIPRRLLALVNAGGLIRAKPALTDFPHLRNAGGYEVDEDTQTFATAVDSPHLNGVQAVHYMAMLEYVSKDMDPLVKRKTA